MKFLAVLAAAAVAISTTSCVVTGSATIHDPITGAVVTIGKNPIGSK